MGSKYCSDYWISDPYRVTGGGHNAIRTTVLNILLKYRHMLSLLS